MSTITATEPAGHIGTLSLDSYRYETFRTTRYDRARIIHAPTLVSFVPTEQIQTAVSITDERILIDTIYPPTSSTRSLSLEFKVHEEKVIAALTEPRGEFRISTPLNKETKRTLSDLTVFPVPESEQQGCPCVCCKSGCDMKLTEKQGHMPRSPQQVTTKRRPKSKDTPQPPPRRSSKPPAPKQASFDNRTSFQLLDKVDEDTILPSRRSSSLFLSTPQKYRT